MFFVLVALPYNAEHPPSNKGTEGCRTLRYVLIVINYTGNSYPEGFSRLADKKTASAGSSILASYSIII